MLSKCTQNYKYDIYIVSDDDLKKVKDLIDKLAPKNINYEIIPLKFDKNIIGKLLKKSGESLSRYTLGVYYRLFLPKLLPCNIKKICYFDVDVCFKGDVAQYYNLDVAKYDAIACCEGYVDQLQKGLTGHLFNELQTSHKQYFNSGVMLINIRK
jgi:lipopolysaccharide biosynthesis glycosyltransferase